MGLLAEFRSSLENPSSPLSFPAEWLLDIFNGGRTDSGLRVSEMTALQVTTVFACTWLISGAVGALELNAYERIFAKDKRAGKRIAYEHDLNDLLEFEPNEEMTSFTFRKTLQAHGLLWGNMYAEIQRDAANRVKALWPRNPARTRPHRVKEATRLPNGEMIPRGALVYKTTEGMEEMNIDPESPVSKEANERMIAAADMFHLPGLALDGRLGQSAIQLARQAVGLALATEKHGAKLFGNGATPRGILEHPGALKPGALETLSRSWKEKYGGENANSIAVLEEGLKFQAIGFKSDEAQFLETRKLQVTEIARVFSVPPHMVGETEKTNRANTEQIGIEFLNYTLKPWLQGWQQELRRKLFSSVGRSAGKFFALFNTRPLTMPSSADRQSFYTAGLQNAYLCTNDTRELEDLNPVDEDWADRFRCQINMIDAERLHNGEPPAADPAPAGGKEPDKQDKLGQRFVRVYFRLFRDAFGRVLARQGADSEAFRRAFLPVLLTLGEDLTREARGEECEAEAYGELMSFLANYIEVMRARAADWKTEEADATARRELARAVRAIYIEASRTAATQQAKQQTELVEAEA